MSKEFLWVEAYRPSTVEETILPQKLKDSFKKFVEDKSIPNLLLAGTPGVGKTTIAKAMMAEIGADYIVINGSKESGIDTLRNTITNYASTVSFTGTRKYIIIDEADYLNPNSMQPGLRGVIEEYSNNCGFILTCNYKNRLIEPLRSRFVTIDFNFNKDEKSQLAKQLFHRMEDILKKEEIAYEKQVVAELVKKYFPDARKIIGELQFYSRSGRIDTGILAQFAVTQLNELVSFMKQKDFSAVRKWIGENSDLSSESVFRMMYDMGTSVFKTSFMPQLVLIISKYQYQEAFAVDKEINLAAAMVEIMLDAEYV